MKNQMMNWQSSGLVLTPNRCYASRAIKAIVTGLCFGLLSIYLAVRFGDFWQLPLAVGSCLVVMSGLYKIFSGDIQLLIPTNDAEIILSFGNCFKQKIMNKNEATIVQNSLNGKPYFAIASKNNPYGKSYQISPFLTETKRKELFMNELLPVIQQQLIS